MTTRESSKSTGEDAPSARSFYGLAEHPNDGIFSSLIKRKGRRLGMGDDCKTACKQVEAYKTSADRLHQSIMFMMVENPVTCRQLISVIKTEPGYKYAATYLKTYDHLQKQGRKGVYENLEPAIKAFENLHVETEKRVKRVLDILKPLNKFIGEDYWEYARLRKVYWDAIAAYDDAVTLQNKERTEQAEKATSTAQTWRNECRTKMMEFIKKSINDQKARHAECVLKFGEDSVSFHRTMSEYINSDGKEEKSKIKSVTK